MRTWYSEKPVVRKRRTILFITIKGFRSRTIHFEFATCIQYYKNPKMQVFQSVLKVFLFKLLETLWECEEET